MGTLDANLSSRGQPLRVSPGPQQAARLMQFAVSMHRKAGREFQIDPCNNLVEIDIFLQRQY